MTVSIPNGAIAKAGKTVTVLFLNLLLAALVWLVVVMVYWTGELRSLTKQMERRVVDTSQNLNGVLIQLGLAADEWQQASREQRQYWAKNSQDTGRAIRNFNGAVTEFRTFVVRTDRRLNDELLPQATTALAHTDENFGKLTVETTVAITQTNQRMQEVMDSLAKATAGGERMLTDPNIARSLEQIAQATENVNLATRDVREVTQRLAKPGNVVWTILKTLLWMGGSAAQMVK